MEVDSRSSRSVSEKVLIGIKNGLIEQLEFLDEEGNPLQVTLLTDVCETQNFLFLDLKISNGKSSIYEGYWLHKPSGNIFPMIDNVHPPRYQEMNNDNHVDCGDVIYTYTEKMYYKNGQLTKESYVSEELSKWFRSFLVDKYGNIYSTSDSEYNGKMITTADKIVSIPSNYQYRIGENGKVYYWVIGEENGLVALTTRGYFNEKGEMVNISEDDFFPSFLGENLKSKSGSELRAFSYTDGNDTYRIYYKYNNATDCGIVSMHHYIHHIHFNDSDDSYTEEKINLNVEAPFELDSILSRYKFCQVLGKYLYLMNENMLYRIDMTTGKIDVINNSYIFYITCEYLGNDEFRLTVMDENQNKILVGVDGNGKSIELSKEKGKFSSITISPIVRI